MADTTIATAALAWALFAAVASGFTPTRPNLRQRQSFCSIRVPEGPLERRASNRRCTDHTSSLWSKKKSIDELVQVYDDTFSDLACTVINCLAVEHSFRLDGETCLYTRPPFNERPLQPLEHAIDSALSALESEKNNSNSSNNERTVVEYWSRVEYMNMDAHVDIDERALEDEGVLHCPEASHVLYLQVNMNEEAGCPTCVFPNQQVGWSFDDKDPVVDVVAVPAVQGRILKFPGSAMHAVPCPADRWLLTGEEEQELRREEKEEEFDDEEDEDYDEEEDDEEEYDDDDDTEDEIERSVLLFNTWATDGPRPSGAQGSIELDKDAYLVAEWERDYGVNAERIRCNPKRTWREAVLTESEPLSRVSPDNNQEQQIRVSLMGEQNRRVFADKTAQLIGPIEAFRAALEQETTATVTRLHHVAE